MDFMILLHIISAIAAFGPALAFPLMLRSGVQASAGQVVQLSQRLVMPGLIGVLVFGFGAVGLSKGDDRIEMSAPWVSLASLAVVVALAAVWGLVIPGAKRAVSLEGEAASRAARRLSPFVGVVHLCMTAGLYLMIWRPGS